MDLLTATQVRQRFGGISDMTLWRWLHDGAVGFPKPVVINRRRYFRVADVDAFQERHHSCAAAAAETACVAGP